MGIDLEAIASMGYDAESPLELDMSPGGIRGISRIAWGLYSGSRMNDGLLVLHGPSVLERRSEFGIAKLLWAGNGLNENYFAISGLGHGRMGVAILQIGNPEFINGRRIIGIGENYTFRLFPDRGVFLEAATLKPLAASSTNLFYYAGASVLFYPLESMEGIPQQQLQPADNQP
ncbi:hypothetical protein HYY72_03545 [Candidatus Woesearchaeota archaeon]|nr:hypothetical protein [Candidatus Woesearchaeota archaeon]